MQKPNDFKSSKSMFRSMNSEMISSNELSLDQFSFTDVKEYRTPARNVE